MKILRDLREGQSICRRHDDERVVVDGRGGGSYLEAPDRAAPG